MVGGRAGVIGALLLVVAAVVGRLGSELVWVDRLLDHPILFAVLAAACGTLGLALVVPWLWLRVVVVVIGVPVTILGAVFGTFVRWSNTTMLDPARELVIRQTAGIGARQWELGCLNDDSADLGYDSARWQDRSHLVVTTGGGAVTTVTVDPRSGEPLETTGAPWTC